MFGCSNATAEIYKWVDKDGKVHYGDKPKDKKHVIPKEIIDNILTKPSYSKRKLQTSLKNRKSARIKKISVHGENSDNEIMRLRKLFKQEKYFQTSKLLEELSLFKSNDLKKELTYIRAFDSFFDNSMDNKKLLDSWVVKMPKDAYAYLARASYFYHLAWKYRGNKYVQKTKKTQLNAMQKQFDNAMNDLNKALSIKPNLLYSYYLGISIASVNGNSKQAFNFLDKGLIYYSNSFYLRARLLGFKVPKWGGSLPEIKMLSEQYESFGTEKNNLSIFKSFPIRAIADILYQNKQYKKAIPYYNEAIRLGEYYLNYFNRGKNFYYTGEYEKALKDFDHTVELNPFDADNYYFRSLALAQLQKYKKAYQDVRTAKLLEPYDKKYQKRMVYLKSGMRIAGIKVTSKEATQKELNKINSQIEKNPKNAVLYYYRTKIFLKRGDVTRALNDLSKAMRLAPERFKFHLLHDQILIKESRFEEIVESWNQYIKLRPNDGKAYLERAGTYYHMLDIENAILDAKRSMELGNKKGKIFYNELKQM